MVIIKLFMMHFLADGPLTQNEWIAINKADNKSEWQFIALFLHCFGYGAIFIILFDNILFGFYLALSHICIDYLLRRKYYLFKSWKYIDQLLHLIILITLFLVIV